LLAQPAALLAAGGWAPSPTWSLTKAPLETAREAAGAVGRLPTNTGVYIGMLGTGQAGDEAPATITFEGVEVGFEVPENYNLPLSKKGGFCLFDLFENAPNQTTVLKFALFGAKSKANENHRPEIRTRQENRCVSEWGYAPMYSFSVSLSTHPRSPRGVTFFQSLGGALSGSAATAPAGSAYGATAASMAVVAPHAAARVSGGGINMCFT